MSILESIHEERKMSLNHWRYRLLHWCFNEKNIQHPRQSSLPNYLYTHYCPLFHLTNFIALFSWLILIIKISIVSFKAVAVTCGNLQNAIFAKFKSEPKTETETEEEEPKLDERFQRKREYKIVLDRLLSSERYFDFEYFWERTNFRYVTREEAETRHRLLVDKIRKAKEKAAERKAKRQARILFWVNFSRAFVKWFIYAFYIALGGFAIWAASVCFWPVIDTCYWLIRWVFDFNYMSLVPFLVLTLKIAIGFGLGTLLLILMNKYKVFKMLIVNIAEGASTCMIPVELLGKMFMAPCRWAHNVGLEIIDFFVVFYEQNCPPIEIISDEEETIENSAEEGV